MISRSSGSLSVDLRVLVICYMGRNRSKHLAQYLSGKGYKTDFAGILPETKNLVTQERIENSQVLVFVLPRIREKFMAKFSVGDQQVITLDVEDRPEIVCPEEHLVTDEELRNFYIKRVYPELEKQINAFLPSPDASGGLQVEFTETE